MIPFPLEGDDSKPNSPLKKLMQGAMNTIIPLSQAATTANALVPEGNMGVAGTTLYLTINGSTYSIALTLV